MSTGRPRLVLGLLAAQHPLRRWIDRRSGAAGVGAAGSGVLLFLAGREHASAREIGAAVHTSPAGTSGLLSRLERDALVLRQPDPQDARAVRVSLTPAGHAAAAAATVALGELNAHLTAGFSDEELAVVDRWLRHVRTLPEA